MFKKGGKLDKALRKLDENTSKATGLENGAKISHVFNPDSPKHKEAVKQLKGKEIPTTTTDAKTTVTIPANTISNNNNESEKSQSATSESQSTTNNSVLPNKTEAIYAKPDLEDAKSTTPTIMTDKQSLEYAILKEAELALTNNNNTNSNSANGTNYVQMYGNSEGGSAKSGNSTTTDIKGTATTSDVMTDEQLAKYLKLMNIESQTTNNNSTTTTQVTPNSNPVNGINPDDVNLAGGAGDGENTEEGQE